MLQYSIGPFPLCDTLEWTEWVNIAPVDYAGTDCSSREMPGARLVISPYVMQLKLSKMTINRILTYWRYPEMMNLQLRTLNEVVLDTVDHGEHDGTILVTTSQLEVLLA